MSLKQPNSNAVWQEPVGAGVSIAIVEAHFVADGGSAYIIEDLPVGNPTAATLVADATGYTLTPGTTPQDLRIIDTGSAGYYTYQ